MYKTSFQFARFLVYSTIALFASMLWTGCANNSTVVVELTKTTLSTSTLIPTNTPELISTVEPTTMKSTPHVSPYITVKVVDIEIRLHDTNPKQVELVIRGTLPDQCTYQFYSVETRMDQNVKVSLQAIHPADTDCPQVPQNIEYELLLGRDMPEVNRGFSEGDYKLIVNNYQTSFSIK